jgi:hypothetical protein
MTVTWTPRWVKEPATSIPMKPAPIWTARARAGLRRDGGGVDDGAEVVDARQITAKEPRPNGPASRGEEGLLEPNGLAVGDGRGVVREVQCAHGDAQAELDIVVVKIRLGVEEEFLPGLLAAQELSRERRTVVGHVGLLADQRDGATCVAPARSSLAA